ARDSIDADRLCNVLELLLAGIYKRELHLAAYVLIHLTGDANAPRLCNAFKSSSDVDTIAVDASIVKNDVTQIDADADAHAAGVFHVGIALRHNPLDRHCALDCAHDTPKLSEDPIAGSVNDATTMLCDDGEHDGLVRLQIADGCLLIGTHEGAVA